MKKYLILTVCLVVLGTSQARAQVAKVALQHGNNVTLYNANELQTSLNAAEDGDFIYLNEGTFIGGITISKKVSLIGAGLNTIIDGNVTVSVNGSLTERLLDALTINAKLILSGNVDGIIIRKCKICWFDLSGNIKNAVIDRCYQTHTYDDGSGIGMKLSNNVKNLRVVNSKIAGLKKSAASVADANFINCNVRIHNYKAGESTSATFINCYVYPDSHCSSSYFTNCRLNKSVNSINEQNCEYEPFMFDSEMELSTTPTSLVGTDGTPIGIYGGTNPFTLIPSVPIVKSYDLKVDTAKKKLNVNVSVESK